MGLTGRGLQELKERAFQHIEKSLTIENVTYEAFSAFTAAFEDVRKVSIRLADYTRRARYSIDCGF